MQNNQDKKLDIPSEANREKHIDFLEAEERTADNSTLNHDRSGRSDDDKKRKEDWQNGLNEGEKIRKGEA